MAASLPAGKAGKSPREPDNFKFFFGGNSITKLVHSKIKKKEKDCKISPATLVGVDRALPTGRGVVEVVTAAETECEFVDIDVIFRSPALLASLRLHHSVPRHRPSAVSARPVGFLAEDS